MYGGGSKRMGRWVKDRIRLARSGYREGSMGKKRAGLDGVIQMNENIKSPNGP